MPTCGLSPLARGTRSDGKSLAGTDRFIPAGAGNTARRHPPPGASAVYPRWRGEHFYCAGNFAITCGLSPLARGTRQLPEEYFAQTRFIPAGAGNTRKNIGIDGDVAVYPRWRGEHTKLFTPLIHSYGLSPLARGTLEWAAQLAEANRFIPAGAGNTALNARCRATVPVYPRWRGEHTVFFAI